MNTCDDFSYKTSTAHLVGQKAEKLLKETLLLLNSLLLTKHPHNLLLKKHPQNLILTKHPHIYF